MLGFRVSRGAAGAVLGGVCLAVSLVGAPQAAATAAPSLTMTMTDSALSATNTAAVGCGSTARATVKQPDGTPVSRGSVLFVSRLADNERGSVVGTAPVSNGSAQMLWIPDTAGHHVINAVYYDDDTEYRTSTSSIEVVAVNLGGLCL
ncbi:Ig-like domain repeat protein [Nocardia sp. NPDC052566]|uniref:Ig-like domain repeat protein n=1 Tax=Nocardia sp. NPDC052566 TaxID=3364330 RepID=UPI0037CBC8FB